MTSSNLSPLGRRRRASARVALYVSFAVTGAGGLALWGALGRLGPSAEVFDWRADYASNPAVDLLRRYIEIDTSLPGGDPSAGAEFVAAEVRGPGVEVTVERVGETEANLWAVLEGDDRRAVVLHHHVDVEPVERPAAWSHPPFEAVIDGPWLYGRGAFDMKSVGVAQIEAFRRLAEAAAAGRRPARSVILLVTSGEETGSELGMRFVLAAHPELVERFAVVLTEGGAVEGREHGDVKYWGTEFAQRRILRMTVCGAHRGPLEELRSELIAEHRTWTGAEVSPEAVAFLRRYAPTRDRPSWRRLLGDPFRLTRDPVALARLPGYLQSLFRNELLPLPVAPTEGGFELPIMVQLVPGADAGAVLAERMPPWRLHGLAATVYDEGAAAHGSPPDHPALGAIAAVLEVRYPGAPIGPIYLPWTITDARFLRARGVPSYGFSPFMVLTPEVLNLASQGTVNERIGLAGFVEGVEIYADLLERLAAGDRDRPSG